ncbi:hypothetical protein OV450_5731 [Actinobacteria bacterium OV450]|nr:hypothetical protein OV450_5731 [Actinobacteria bacterium OV450]
MTAKNSLHARTPSAARTLLENLFTEHALTVRWTLVQKATDLAKAREWLESWTDVSEVEGILVKPLNGSHQAGYRGWTKIGRRHTTEAVVGAITGTPARPHPGPPAPRPARSSGSSGPPGWPVRRRRAGQRTASRLLRRTTRPVR